ncbi:hypothetical protein [Mastigocoleus testarum]|uniref:Uncharacterized protein n=1 Tax=Mastigocoleus testarum BC008 TaxID=371196 RepID=A0A0V8A0V0_9CYAN|nr:hypothetical protein [Mastigocoleus testarum]KST70408.1 hypothetical protein BC008_45280 [Mastigocoleus testarum BC008]
MSKINQIVKYFTDYFEELDFFEVFLGNPSSEENLGKITLKIPAINIGVSEHPLNPEEKIQRIEKSYLIFQGVIYSQRKLQNYDENKVDFIGESYKVIDIDVNNSDKKEMFDLEGVDYCKRFYVISWEILADKFTLAIPDDSRISFSNWNYFNLD